MPTSRPSSRRVVILLVLTALALMTVDVRGFGPLVRAREVTLTVTRPPRDALRWAASPLVSGWRGAVGYDELADENAALRDRVAQLEGALAAVPDAEAELADLLRAADIGYLGDVPRVTARVTVDRQTGLERLVEIDKGAAHGLRPGMPVVTGTGLVGRLDVVTPVRSLVRLVTQPRFNVGVRSASGAVGVARGDGTGHPLVLELSEADGPPGPVGERFETTGSTRSVFPPGVPVGRLVEGPQAGGRRLEPLADLDRLAYLTVLQWEPPG